VFVQSGRMTFATRRVFAGSFLAATMVAGMSAQSAPGTATRHRVLFNRFLVPVMTMFIADADGKNERALHPTSGLEYSPSWSADGHWIVFTAERDGQADIYRVHPDGAGLQQLTDDPAFDDQGTLSPDGKTLAFVSTRNGGTANVWLKDLAAGSYTNLTRSHSGNFRPSFSPDGASIAFSSDRDSNAGAVFGRFQQLQSLGLYVAKADGTGLRRLTRRDGFSGSPSWSPDGGRLIFYETDEVGAFLAKDGESRTEIVAIDVATGKRTLLTGSTETKLSPHWLPDGGFSYVCRAGNPENGLKVRHLGQRTVTAIKGAVRGASWSPGGERVVYERVSRLGSSEPLVPTFSRDPEFELVLSEPFPAFSPDGKRVAYTEWGTEKSDTTGLELSSPSGTTIEVMSADGTERHTVFHREGLMAFSAEWSRAGDEIMFSAGRFFRSTAPAHIDSIRPDGSGQHAIVDEGLNDGFPSWSPDGSRLVFKRGKQLVIMSVADHKIVPLTDGAHFDNFPVWSPKGDLITFSSDRDGDFEVYTIRPDGTALRPLTKAPGPNVHSVWCAGGDWIVFSSGRMGFKDEMALYDSVPQPYGEIFAMRADGSDVRQLTDNKWEDASAACRPEPPARR
jgi:TolB protein